MSRFPTFPALIAATTLALMACGGGESADVDTTEPGVDTTQPGSDAPAPSTSDPEPTPTDPTPEPADSDVPDGLAAVVSSTEIPTTVVDDIYDDIADSPTLAAQLETGDGTLRTGLQAQILSQLVINEILVRAAATEFEIELTASDLDAAEGQLEADAGGPEAFEAQLETSGMSRETFAQLTLPFAALLDALEAEFGELSPDPADPEAIPAGQAALQEWGTAQFAEADVAVAADYGTWNPAFGQIEPPLAPAPGE